MREEDFERMEFDEALESISQTIDLKSSGKIHRKGVGRVIDGLILLRQGFQETWQFMVLAQAFWLFLGLLPNVTDVLNGTFDMLGFSLRLQTEQLAVFAIVVMFLLLVVGVALLLYGGTKRHSMLINQRQNPAQKLDYEAYRIIMRRLDEIEGRLDKE